MNSSDTLDGYDQIAPMYEEYSKKRFAYLNSIESLVTDCLTPESRLLDIGAGDGRRLAKICSASSLKDVVAVEPSANMAKLCRERLDFPVHEVLGEQLDSLSVGSFDVITALWNVLGHIPGSDKRLKTLENITDKLKPNGIFLLDVNNRHNSEAYGLWRVAYRRVIDFLIFDEARGDTTFEWDLNGHKISGSGHLFVPMEIEELFAKAKLKVLNVMSVDYATGQVCKSKYSGQLFYKLTHI